MDRAEVRAGLVRVLQDAHAGELATAVEWLEAMRVEEVRHERWFGDQIRGHWLLRPTSRVLGWSPPE